MKSYLTRITLGFVLVLSSFAHAQDSKVNWNTITDYDNHCTIMFPTLPTETYKNTAEGFKTTTHSLYGQSSYFLKILQFKNEPSDKKAKATKVLTSLASKVKGKVTEQVDWVEGSDTGVKGIIVIPGDGAAKPEMTVLCNVIIVGSVQYQIMVLTPTEIYDEAFDGRFVSSFKFI
jgi:hypothetical protein